MKKHEILKNGLSLRGKVQTLLILISVSKLSFTMSSAGQISINGKVIDNSVKSLPGVTVIEKATVNSTTINRETKTLSRQRNKVLVEWTAMYNPHIEEIGVDIFDHNDLFKISQRIIDASIGTKMPQNPDIISFSYVFIKG